MRQVPPRTLDGRYMVVRGRLWRLSNPSLEPEQREYWVAELMTARRSVRAARGDATALAAARAAVDRAKCALGERGPVWWKDGSADFNRRLVANTPYADWFDDFIAEQIIAVLAARAPGSSSCPSEVARAIAPDDERAWRALMPRIRAVTRTLIRSERVRATRGKQTLTEDQLTGGPIRIRRGPRF